MEKSDFVKSMKKIWIILCVALLVLVGCGGEVPPAEIEVTTEPLETEAPAPVDCVLIENGICRFTVVRPENADAQTVEYAQSIYSALSSQSTERVMLATDWIKPGTEYDSSTLEILVGKTAYPESEQALAQVGYNQNGLIMVGNKLCVVGVSAESLKGAADRLVSVIKNSAQRGESGTNVTMAAMYFKAVNMKGCDFDLPVFEGATFSGTYDCNDNVYKAFFRDVEEAEFTAYWNALAADGAVEIDRRVLGANTFIDAEWGKWTINVSFYPSIGEVGIAVMRSRNDRPAAAVSEYTPVEPLLTQLANPNLEAAGGMGYLIRLEDSTFIVVDGGYNETGSNEVSNLYELMRTQNTRADGKIIIRAWFITHAHNDHYNVLRSFCNEYANRVKVESLLFNPMASFYQAMTETPGGWDVRDAVSKFPGCTYVKIMAGQVLEYPGCTLEVLYTSDNVYMLKSLTSYNDSSAVVRLNIKEQSFLVLGDVQGQAAPWIADAWGEYLKSDIAQKAHHGNKGGSMALYDLIQPQIIFWPSSSGSYDSWSRSISMNKTLLSRDYVKEVLVSGSGVTTLTLPYTPGK